jgi:hypothetical protein
MMDEPLEEASFAIALVGAMRESVARSREPAHFYGLVRGLDIALATLRGSRHDVRGEQLRERASRPAGNDAYGAGVAFGLELASDLTMRPKSSSPFITPIGAGCPPSSLCVK